MIHPNYQLKYFPVEEEFLLGVSIYEGQVVGLILDLKG